MTKTLLKSSLLVVFLWGCEQKAEPIDATPAEQEEKQHEQGYIDTH